nr:hypothetical protein [uncultured Flavobacterium sp.]
MKYVEVCLFVLTIASLSFFLIDFPGGTLFTVLQLTTISLLYFVLGFAIFNSIRLRRIFKKESYQNVSGLRIVGAIGTGMTLSIVIIGILFTVMQWPGASFNLLIGLVFTAIISLVSIIKYLMSKSAYYKKILVRTLGFGAVAFALFSIPKITWIEIKYKNHPAVIEAYQKAFADPDNPAVWDVVKAEKDKLYESEGED